MASLYEECIDALGNFVSILNTKDSQAVNAKMFDSYEFENGRIDWNQYSYYVEIEDVNDILNILTENDCIVVWDKFDLPAIKSNLNSIMSNIDDVTAVAFDTWIIGLGFEWIIEFYHEGAIRLLRLTDLTR